MKQIKEVPPVYELVFKLRKLSEAAKQVAYAHSQAEAEYFTVKYLRPLIKETDTLLNESK
jgi:hypothetical protein